MGGIFNLENPFWQAVSRITDLIWLTVLWFLSAIPMMIGYSLLGGTDVLVEVLETENMVAMLFFVVVSVLLTFLIGPSTTAFFYVGQKIVGDEEGYVTKQYFHSFKQNFRQGSIIWLIMAFFGGMLMFNLFFYRTLQGNASSIMLVLILVMVVFYTMTMQFVFPVLSKFDNTIFNIIKFAFLIALRNFGWTLLMIVIFVGTIAAGTFILPIMLLAPGIIVGLDSLIIRHVFKPYIATALGQDAEKTEEEERKEQEMLQDYEAKTNPMNRPWEKETGLQDPAEETAGEADGMPEEGTGADTAEKSGEN